MKPVLLDDIKSHPVLVKKYEVVNKIALILSLIGGVMFGIELFKTSSIFLLMYVILTIILPTIMGLVFGRYAFNYLKKED